MVTSQVRNENAEDFLALLKEWKKLCDLFPLIDNESSKRDNDDCPNEQSDDDDGSDDSEVYEVEKILAICYGEPKGSKKPGLHFKVVELSFQNPGLHMIIPAYEIEETIFIP